MLKRLFGPRIGNRSILTMLGAILVDLPQISGTTGMTAGTGAASHPAGGEA